jgi:hypothetical protein
MDGPGYLALINDHGPGLIVKGRPAKAILAKMAAASGRIRKSAARALGGTNPAEFPLTIRAEKDPALNGHRGSAEGTTGGINQGSESNPPGRT